MSESESPGARALRMWQKRDFAGICQTLDRLETLIIKRKVLPGKVNLLLALIHVLSRVQIANDSSATHLFQTYRDVFEDSIIFKSLEILLLLNNGSLKKAKKKLANLSYHHRGTQGDTFFILLTRFWCDNQLSPTELKSLKQLNEQYSLGSNEFMKYEVKSLYKEVVKADGLVLQFANVVKVCNDDHAETEEVSLKHADLS